MADGARFVRRIGVARDAPRDRCPFDLPVVERLRDSGGLPIPAGVTFLVGENGSGKSTVVEALAVAIGLNAEGGSQNYRFETRSSESELSRHLDVAWGPSKPRSKFFLRAESYYNVATATEELGAHQVGLFGGVSPHERSHGEAFVDVLRHRFGPRGLYVMDEPEAALSPRGCMAVLTLMAQLVDDGCQLVVATHSPILLALPGATIYEIDDEGDITEVAYDDAETVRLTRTFLDRPSDFLSILLDDDG